MGSGRPRKPIELIQGHRTKAELEQRKREQLDVALVDVKAPDYLPEELKADFDEFARKLLLVGIMTELDEDALARYLIAREEYKLLFPRYNKMIKEEPGERDTNTIGLQVDRVVKQLRTLASDLGLTIRSRCNLVIPNVKEPEENKFKKYMK